MIVGAWQPARGRIRLDGAARDQWSPDELGRHVGYLPQEASIFRKLSVSDNILAILENRQDLDRGGREQHLDELLEELHVGHVRTSLGISLSGGERRRAEIARALAAGPRFILLDEPLAGIDPIAVNDIRELVLHLKDRGIGVLITDHNVRETLKITDRAYIINNGEILRFGAPEELSSDPQVRKIYLGEDFTL